MMAHSHVALRWLPRNFVVPVVTISLVFIYLGLNPYTALAASLSWVSIGAAGAWLIESLLGKLDARHQLPLALGPGALLFLGLMVFSYLGVAGRVLGLCLVIGVTVLGAALWVKGSRADEASSFRISLLLAFFGLALLANSKEFPNLLLPAIGVVVLAAVWNRLISGSSKLLGVTLALVLLVHDMLTRPEFWWWSSDDTTTLAGIGTMVIERGQVSETAGWQTSSHHWLLHAWLALWNRISSGHIFETYQIAWPFVAAVSLFASLWLCIEFFSDKPAAIGAYIGTGVVSAGLIRLEWPAPQEQQPFLFAMIACCALWLRTRETCRKRTLWHSVIGLAFVLVVVPSILFVLKPSLLIAHLLLLLGTTLVDLEFYNGWRRAAGLAITLSAISLGIFVMWIGSSWISDRSFTSFAVKWFPSDLGWCSYSALPGSLACVLSLQALIVTATCLSISLLSLSGRATRTLQLMLLLVPLTIAYLPLRYFISSDVGSGAPSFYRLSEMAMMVIIALGFSFAWSQLQAPVSVFFVAGGLSLLIYSIGQLPSILYDTVDAVFVASRVLRFLSPTDGIALVLASLLAILVSRKVRFSQQSKKSYYYIVAPVSYTHLTLPTKA